jgi:hypothetical protein
MRSRMSSAISWLDRSRSLFGGQVERQVAHLRFRAQEIMAHEAVEVERRGGAGMGLHRFDFLELEHLRATACATASVASTDVPSGMSMTTESSDLLSNGKSFTVTSLV